MVRRFRWVVKELLLVSNHSIIEHLLCASTILGIDEEARQSPCLYSSGRRQTTTKQAS